MPPCPTCGDRQFANYEALKQHLDSSSAPHPACAACDRRFSSENALEAHMAAKHPPTYDCTLCQRSYRALFALEDHYRGSPSHPNCSKCGRGFFDAAANEEHQRDAHPRTACVPCGGRLVYNDSLEKHYADSPNHPTCLFCSQGCKDEPSLTEHIKTVHADGHCEPCGLDFRTPDESRSHFWANPLHPKCQECRLGFLDEAAKNDHVLSAHTIHTSEPGDVTPTATSSTDAVPGNDSTPAKTSPGATRIAAFSTNGASGPSPYAQNSPHLESTGFTPISPRHHPLHDFISRERKIHANSPDLRLETGFTSPIKDVLPLASPSVPLPRPGNRIEQVWSSKENKEIAPARDPRTFEPAPKQTQLSHWALPGVPQRPNQSPPRSTTVPTSTAAFSTGSLSPPTSVISSPPHSQQIIGSSPRSSLPPYSPPLYSSLNDGAPGSFIPRRERNYGPPAAAPQYGPPGADLRPQLYRGTIHQMRGFGRVGMGPFTSAGPIAQYRNTNGLPHRGSDPTGISTISTNNFVHRSRFSTGFNPLPPPASSDIDWRSVIGDRERNQQRRSEEERSEFSISVRSETRRGSGNGQPLVASVNPSLLSLTLPGSTTPVMNGRNAPLPSHAASHSAGTSPSPTLSVMGHSPSSAVQEHEAETRPTTASSHRAPSLKIIYNTEYGSSPPRSPEVSSPTHLGPLPAISPLLTTPVDIPEATYPLPESPPSIPSTALPTPDTAPTPTIPADTPCTPSPVTLAPLLPSFFDLEEDKISESINISSSPSQSRVSPRPDLSLLPVEPMSAGSGLSPTTIDIEGEGDDTRRLEGLSPTASPPPRAELKAKEDEEQLLVDLSTPVSNAGDRRMQDFFSNIVSSALGEGVEEGREEQILDAVSPVEGRLIEGVVAPVVDTHIALQAPPEPLTPVEKGGLTMAVSMKSSLSTSGVQTEPLVDEPTRNPLHCRDCLADSCDDITATMCGHIFCNRCIVQAVMKTSRCPVCSTPTLLYCLFRLDLAA